MTQDPYADRGATASDPITDRPETSNPDPGPDPSSPGGDVWPPRAVDSTTPAPTTPDSTTQSSSTDTAKQEAGAVKDTAADAGRQVADTAKGQAQNVVEETKTQAAGLMEQVKGEASSQVGTQQQRLAGIVGSYSQELDSMASNSEESGPLTDLVRQGADKGREFSGWLDKHEPGDLLAEVQSFARRRPAVFLIGAAVAGVAVGRLSRGFAAEVKDDKQSQYETDATTASSGQSATAGGDQMPASTVEVVPAQEEAYRGVDTASVENVVDYGPANATGELRNDDVIR